ncbi:hypothetical protein [Streptomyces cucumeris]|uniref:hypothetical protein n=1 Tax=Streptomyces cucumeris TaxID=2962890 RepID=UPI003D75B65C
MIGRRRTSPVVPADGAHTRRLTPHQQAVHNEPNDLDACRTDYATGAEDRAAFDARAREQDPENRRAAR